MLKYLLALMLVVWPLACKNSAKKESPHTDEVSYLIEGNIRLPVITLPSEAVGQGSYLEVCSNSEQCYKFLTDKPRIVLRGLLPGSYKATVYQCISDTKSYSCDQKINSYTVEQTRYPESATQLSIVGDAVWDSRQYPLARALYASMADYRKNIKECLQTYNSAPQEAKFGYEAQAATLDQFLAEGPLKGSILLAELAAKEPISAEQLMGGGGLLNLIDPGPPKDFRVRLINYTSFPVEQLRIFKENSWSVDKEALFDYLAPNSNGHSAVLIERLNAATGNYETYRYLTWPIQNSLDDELESYTKRSRFVTELPPVSQEQILKFEAWFRTSEYSSVPSIPDDELDANSLAEKRLAAKKEIAKILGIPEAKMKEFSQPKNKAVVLDPTINKYIALDQAKAAMQEHFWIGYPLSDGDASGEPPEEVQKKIYEIREQLLKQGVSAAEKVSLKTRLKETIAIRDKQMVYYDLEKQKFLEIDSTLEDLSRRIADSSLDNKTRSSHKEKKHLILKRRDRAVALWKAVEDATVETNIADKWYKKWPPYQNFAKDKVDAELSELHKQLDNYIDLEVKTVFAKKALTREQKLEINAQKEGALNNIRRVLGISPRPDMEKFVFDAANPWYALPPEKIFKNEHGIDPSDSRAWNSWLDSVNWELRDFPIGFRDKHAFEDIDGLKSRYKVNEAIDFQGAKQGWALFVAEQVNPQIMQFNEAVWKAHKKPVQFGKSYDIKWNNCACAASKSLDVLYNTSSFNSKIITPGLLAERAKNYTEMVQRNNIDVLKTPSLLNRSLYAFTGAAAAVAVMASISFLVNQQEPLSLAGSDVAEQLRICFNARQEQFQFESNVLMERSQGTHMLQSALRVLLEK